MKKQCNVTVVLMATLFTFFLADISYLVSGADVGLVYAKSYGSRSSFSSSRSSSWGRSKPASTTKYTRPVKRTTNTQYQKPASQKTVAKKYDNPDVKAVTSKYQKPRKVVGNKVAKKRPLPKSKRQVQKERQLAAKKRNVRRAEIEKTRQNQVYKNATAGQTFSRDSINSERNSFNTQYSSRYPERQVVVINQGGSYGSSGFSDMFMSMMMYDALFGYNHRDDDDYKEWRREADLQARENEQLRNQLAQSDREIARMEKEGVAKDPDYMPEGIPAAVMFSEDVLMGDIPEPAKLRFYAGHNDGNYYAWCNQLRDRLIGAVNVECIDDTKGSQDNLVAYTSGKADAMLAQSDIIAQYLKVNRSKKIGKLQTDVYPEYLFMLTNKSSNIRKITDIDLRKKEALQVGPVGSGTYEAFKNLSQTSEGLKQITTLNFSYEKALNHVLTNPDAAMFYVGSLHSKIIQGIESKHGDEMRLTEISEQRFSEMLDAEDNLVYQLRDIPEGLYPKLQAGKYFGTNSVKTLSVSAVFALHPKWAKEHKRGEEAIDRALADMVQ